MSAGAGAAAPRYLAATLHALTAPPAPVIEQRPRPPLPAGAVRVAVAVAGVSFVDALIASGAYQVRPSLPFVPGSEFAGTIVEAGEAVPGDWIGRRVLGSAFGGAFAGEVIVAADAVHLMPAGMAFEQAAVFMVSFATAYHALVDRGGIRSGQSVLVLGAAGGVGLAAVQVAVALGASVVGLASTPPKRALVERMGGTAVERSPDWPVLARAANDGQPFALVVDPVGGALSVPAFKLLGWGGRQLVLGFASGAIPAIPGNLPLLRGAALVGVDLRRAYEQRPALRAEHAAALFALYEAGALRSVIAARYPLAAAGEALAAAAGGATGRIVIDMGRAPAASTRAAQRAAATPAAIAVPETSIDS